MPWPCDVRSVSSADCAPPCASVSVTARTPWPSPVARGTQPCRPSSKSALMRPRCPAAGSGPAHGGQGERPALVEALLDDGLRRRDGAGPRPPPSCMSTTSPDFMAVRSRVVSVASSCVSQSLIVLTTASGCMPSATAAFWFAVVHDAVGGAEERHLRRRVAQRRADDRQVVGEVLLDLGLRAVEHVVGACRGCRACDRRRRSACRIVGAARGLDVLADHAERGVEVLGRQEVEQLGGVGAVGAVVERERRPVAGALRRGDRGRRRVERAAGQDVGGLGLLATGRGRDREVVDQVRVRARRARPCRCRPAASRGRRRPAPCTCRSPWSTRQRSSSCCPPRSRRASRRGAPRPSRPCPGPAARASTASARCRAPRPRTGRRRSGCRRSPRVRLATWRAGLPSTSTTDSVAPPLGRPVAVRAVGEVGRDDRARRTASRAGP